MSEHKNGGIDYIELPAADVAKAKRFYGEAFGWTFQDWGPGPQYVSFSNAGLEGGFRVGEAAAQGGALVILYASDLDAMEQRVIDAGGTIGAKHEFPGGRRFHFTDPNGNELAVWSEQ
ncbi:MAG: VOC family protein [Phycisphaerales bacterium]|nr:VOC family protein [Phycisphaerales bacterium]